MTGRDLTESDVLLAAAELVAAFGANDEERYFGAFGEQATMIFHTEASRLQSRAEYRELWRSWRASGWQVLECTSSEQQVQLFGDTAVFSHRVQTRVSDPAGEHQLAERETVVFRRTTAGDLQVVHEHLSPEPDHTLS